MCVFLWEIAFGPRFPDMAYVLAYCTWTIHMMLNVSHLPLVVNFFWLMLYTTGWRMRSLMRWLV